MTDGHRIPQDAGDLIRSLQRRVGALERRGSISTARGDATNPASYGAVGDSATDDTGALQAAINVSARDNVVLDLRGRTYVTSATLDIPYRAHIQNGTIRCVTAAIKTMKVTGNDVTLRDLSLAGPNAAAAFVVNEHGIWAEGPSAASMLTNLLIERCNVDKIGDWGIALKWVDGFRVIGCNLTNIGYMGIGTLSARNGIIDSNYIDNVLGDPFGPDDAYGIALSRSAEVASYTTAPMVERISVTNNLIKNVPWEGIDAHGGRHLVVSDNTIVACWTGIALVGDDAEGNITTYACKQFVISNNVIDSLKTDGTAGPGITVAGAQATSGSSSDPALEYAQGVVTNNVVRNHGTQTDDLSGGLYMRNTMGLVVSANKFENCSPTAICSYYDNRALAITGNTCLDPWSNSTLNVSFVTLRTNNNIQVTIAGNSTRVTGLKTATTLLRYGILSFGTNSEISVGHNVLNHATVRFSGTGLPGFNADTTGATLAALETEVNQLKATLRSAGLIDG